MSLIKNIHARQILDSRGFPTLEVEVVLDTDRVGRAAVPSGASTGLHEAHELRDGDKNFYLGKGVTRAVENVKKNIFPALEDRNVSNLEEIDRIMRELDGTPNKSKLGANAILGVSLACAHAASHVTGQPLFRHLGGLECNKLPVPLMNFLNGGVHSNNGLNVQEFMIAPVCGGRFSEALRAGSEIFHTLKKELNSRGLSTAVGDEGGFAPALKSNQEALDFLCLAIERAGYRLGEDVLVALDVASSEFFKDGHYHWEGKALTAEELGEIYAGWSKKYPLISIEDAFAEDDWDGWRHFTSQWGDRLQIVGDDLFVTNPERLKLGIERKAANALLVKVNQIGTLTETRSAVKMAQEAGFATIMSHRSGETEDTTIADLAVALNCPQIKTGSVCRSERMAKYNQLLRIEELLGDKAEFWGRKAFRV